VQPAGWHGCFHSRCAPVVPIVFPNHLRTRVDAMAMLPLRALTHGLEQAQQMVR
jgi:hypothetical protein